MKTRFFALQSLENTGTSLVTNTQVSLLKRKIIEAEKDKKRLEGKAKWSKGYTQRQKKGRNSQTQVGTKYLRSDE